MSVSVGDVARRDVTSSDEDRIGTGGGIEGPGRAGRGRVPSLTVAYHSNFWPAPRFAHEVVVLVPEATARVLADLGEVAAGERAPEEGHRHRVGVGIGHADAERR